MRRFALVLAALVLPLAAPSRAETPCDLLPTVGTRVETTTKPGPSVPKTGLGCPRGWTDQGSTCRGPDVTEPKTVQTNPRDDCERALRVSIARVKDIDGQVLQGNTVTKPGPVKLLVEGDGIANATSAEMGGGIGVTVGAAAQRLGSTPQGTCLPPNCQVVQLDAFPNVPPGHQTLTLFTPHRYGKASVDLEIVPAPVPQPLGDAECANGPHSAHAELVLGSTQLSYGSSVSSNQLIVTFPKQPTGPAMPWRATLHTSMLGAISPSTTVASPPASSPLTFSFSGPPMPHVPPPSGGTGGHVAPARTDLTLVRRCVWAKLEWSQGTEIVAVGVSVR